MYNTSVTNDILTGGGLDERDPQQAEAYSSVPLSNGLHG
jgi:hypothetical protein